MRTLLLMLLVSLPALAFAEDGAAPPSAVTELLNNVINLVILIATPILLKLASRAIDKFEERTGIELTVQERKQVADGVEKAVAYAEEQGHKAVATGAPALTGNTKMTKALDFLTTYVKQQKLVDVSPDHLTQLLEARLHLVRPNKTSVTTSVQVSAAPAPEPEPVAAPAPKTTTPAPAVVAVIAEEAPAKEEAEPKAEQEAKAEEEVAGELSEPVKKDKEVGAKSHVKSKTVPSASPSSRSKTKRKP